MIYVIPAFITIVVGIISLVEFFKFPDNQVLWYINLIPFSVSIVLSIANWATKELDNRQSDLKIIKLVKFIKRIQYIYIIIVIGSFVFISLGVKPPTGTGEDSSNAITEITTLYPTTTTSTTIPPTTIPLPIQTTSPKPEKKGYFNVIKNTWDWTWKGGFYSESIVLIDKFEVPRDARYRFDFPWISNVENEYYINIKNSVGEEIKDAYSSSEGFTCCLKAGETYTIAITAHSFVSAFDFKITMHIPDNYDN